MPRLLVRTPTIAFMTVSAIATAREDDAALCFSLDELNPRSTHVLFRNSTPGQGLNWPVKGFLMTPRIRGKNCQANTLQPRLVKSMFVQIEADMR
jgi:hypothetical protein